MLESWGQLFSNWSSEDGFLNKHQKKIAEHWSAVLSSFTGHVNGRAALCMKSNFYFYFTLVLIF